MNVYHACEQAYRNGFDAGLISANNPNIEMKTRLKIAYEQVAAVHTELSKANTVGEYTVALRCVQEALSKLTEAQINFGTAINEDEHRTGIGHCSIFETDQLELILEQQSGII